MKEIAVIMSVYQEDKLLYVKEALKSLYLQTMRADIFIYQDGNISYELEDYLERELLSNRIVYLEKSIINRGLAYSMNLLLKINCINNWMISTSIPIINRSKYNKVITTFICVYLYFNLVVCARICFYLKTV